MGDVTTQPSSEDQQRRWTDLVKQIEEHRSAYYLHDAPTVSDAEYDELISELEQLEKQNPELKRPESPTQTVGGDVSTAFAPVEHAQQMLSLDNVFSVDELKTWLECTAKELGQTPRCLGVLNIDRRAVSLTYE